MKINDYLKGSQDCTLSQVVYRGCSLRGGVNKLVGGLAYKSARLEAKKLKDAGFIVDILSSRF